MQEHECCLSPFGIREKIFFKKDGPSRSTLPFSFFPKREKKQNSGIEWSHVGSVPCASPSLFRLVSPVLHPGRSMPLFCCLISFGTSEKETDDEIAVDDIIFLTAADAEEW